MMDLLVDGAAALGLILDAGQVARFQAYYDLLVDWNTRVNLTAITASASVQTRHFVDSLAVAAALIAWDRAPTQPHPPNPSLQGEDRDPLFAIRDPRSAQSAFVDLGTGAGLPGLPLKILWPALPLTLVDSIGKKTAFVQAVVAALDLRGATVLTARAETLGLDKNYRAGYAVATARAVAALPVLAEYGLPLCRVGGILCAPKKGDLAAELAAAERAVAHLGGGPPAVFRYRLPDDAEERLIIGLPKIAETPAGYPRRVGLARSRPLG